MEYSRYITNINENQNDPFHRSGGGNDPFHRSGSSNDPFHRSGGNDPFHRSGNNNDPFHRNDPFHHDHSGTSGTSGTAGTSGSSGGNVNTNDMPADVKGFQDWLDTKYSWATGYKDGKVNKGQAVQGFHSGGYGNFGPRTKAAWVKFKDEYIKQGGKAVPLKTGAGSTPTQTSADNSATNLSGQLIPAYVGTAKEYIDYKTTNWKLCKDGFPPNGIPYGCKSDTIRIMKQMLGSGSTNDGVYGNDFIQQLVNDGFIGPDEGEQYKKDHSLRITKDLYNRISQRPMTHEKLIYNPSTVADIDSINESIKINTKKALKSYFN